MNIQQLDTHCTKEEWLQVFEQAFGSQTSHFQDHAYIYFHAKGYLGVFSSGSKASKMQYKGKLTIDDILWVSKKYFPDYRKCSLDEFRILRHTFEFMQKGALQSCKSCLDWLGGITSNQTPDLIEDQLCCLIEQQIQIKHQQLLKTLRNFLEIAEELDDSRFYRAYKVYLSKEKKWEETFNKNNSPRYLILKQQKHELTNILIDFQKFVCFSEKILYIAKQKKTLYHLLCIHSDSSIKRETIKQIEGTLNHLINQRFDQTASFHDEQMYEKQIDQLDVELEKCQYMIIQACENQKDYESRLVEEIMTHRRQINISPLKTFSKFYKSFKEDSLFFLPLKEESDKMVHVTKCFLS